MAVPDPKSNGVECHECLGFANYFQDETECPENPEHTVSPVYMSTEPLGRDDDEDNRLPDGSYVYNVDA